MKDVQNYYAENPIEQINKPSDECPFHKCDGSGFLWFKDWSAATEIQKNGKLDDEIVYKSDKKFEWKEPCKCYEQRQKQVEHKRNLATAGIPKLFANARFQNFSTKYAGENKEIATIAKTAAINYVSNFNVMRQSGKGLYIYSETKGSGKTRLSVTIANELIDNGESVLVVKATNVSKEVRKTYNKDSGVGELEIIKEFQQSPVLIIDDIAVEKPTDFIGELLYSIFDYRVEHKLPTIVTSNKTIEEMSDMYSDGRVSSRLKKLCIEVYMPEESMRDRESEYENNQLEELLFKEAN